MATERPHKRPAPPSKEGPKTNVPVIRGTEIVAAPINAAATLAEGSARVVSAVLSRLVRV